MHRHEDENSSLTRLPELAQPLLQFDLAAEIEHLHREDSWQRDTGRSSRTLVKQPDFRIVLVAMKAATEMKEHRAERWFAELDCKAIRRGAFRSVDDLRTSIDAFLSAWNNDPKPFVWTATIESITEKLSHCRQTLEKIQPGCSTPKTRKSKKTTA